LKTFGSRKVAIIGSLNTLNTGDIAIMSVVRDYIKESTGIKPVMLSWRYCNTNNFDSIIICGGDVLHDRTPANFSKLKAVLRHTKNVVFLGVGVPGFYLTPKEQVYKLLSKANKIIVRDKTSGDRLRTFGLNNVIDSFDNAFLLYNDSEKRDSDRKERKTIGINIKEYKSVGLNDKWTKNKLRSEGNSLISREQLSLSEYLKNYIGIITHYKNLGWNIVLLSFTYNDELFVKTHFGSEFHIIPFTKNFENLKRTIRGLDGVFCTRYHSLVFSLLENKPVCGYAYSDKVDNLCQYLNLDNFINREEWNNRTNHNRDLVLKKATKLELPKMTLLARSGIKPIVSVLKNESRRN